MKAWRTTTPCAIAVAILLAAAPAARANPVEGTRFEAVHETRQARLLLRGEGVMRWLVVVRAYAAALYLGEGVRAEDVLGDVPKRLEIEYFHAIEAADFARATWETIPRNTPAAELERLGPRIERLNALYRGVRPGDRYALTYLPGVGTELSLNGIVLGRIEGADFARAVFGIWLGAKPLDVELKAALVGAR